jgi:hypothetical protein
VIEGDDVEDSAEEKPEVGAGTHSETKKKLTFKLKKFVSKEAPDANTLDGEDDRRLRRWAVESGLRNINYIYLGDLIDAAVNNVLSRDDFDSEINYGNIRFALGPVVFSHPNPDLFQLVNVNLADIPISIELYNDFIREKAVSRQSDSYPLLIFIRDVINDLVFEALGPNCYGGTANHGVRVDSGQIIADSAAGNVDPLLLARNSSGEKPLRIDLDKYGPSVTSEVKKGSGKTKQVNESKFIFNSFNSKKISEKYNYFVIYGVDRGSQVKAYTDGDLNRKSRYDRDFDKGVYHLTTGLDRGLVKNMKFNKTDIPYLREARFFESDMQPDLQLSNVYNANVSMFGNNLFYPGQRVYINPRGLGSDLLGDPAKKRSYANIMGLGGYHTIIRVENKITMAGFETSLTALFDNSGDGFDPVPTEKNKAGDEVIEECNFVEGAMADLLSSFRESGVDTQAELHAGMAKSTFDPGARTA